MSMPTTKSLLIEAKDEIVATFEGANDFHDALAEAVSNIAARAFGGSPVSDPRTPALVNELVTGTVHGVAAVGGDVGTAARSILTGTVRGMRRVGTGDVEAVAVACAALVAEVAELGGGVSDAAVGAVEGSIAVAGDLGISAEDAAAAAAWGVSQIVGPMGYGAVQEVQRALSKGIRSVDVELPDPFKAS